MAKAKVAGQGSGIRGQGSSGRNSVPPTPDPWLLTPDPWLWPLLGALVLAPLEAAQLDRMWVAAVNVLIAAAVLLWAALSPAVQLPPVSGKGSAVASDDGPTVFTRPTRSDLVDRLSSTRWLGLFLGLNLLSLGVSIYVHGTLTALLDLAGLISAYLLLAHGGAGRKAVVWVLGALLAAGLLACLEAVREYAVKAWRENDPGWRAFGPFFNPNLLAAIAILLAPVALAWMLRSHRRVERVAAGASTLVLLAALLVSGSRGGALAFMVGLAAFVGVAIARRLRLDRQRIRAILGLLIVLLPLMWLLRVPMLGRLAHIRGTPVLEAGSPAATASSRSDAFRKLTWLATVRMVREKPVLGTGAGTFKFALPRYAIAGYTGMAHESYLQTAAESGIPSLLAWLAALALVLNRLVSRRSGEPDWLLAGLAGGLAAAMAHNLVDYSWSVTGTALPFWALMGVAVALTPAHDGIHHRDTETRRGIGEVDRQGDRATRATRVIQASSLGPSTARRVSMGIAGALLLGLNAVWQLAAAHQNQAAVAIQDRDAGRALEQYQAAAALSPLDAELQVDLARIEEATGDRVAAETALRRAAALAPTWGRPHYRLGRLLEASGQLTPAAAVYEKAAELDPRATPPLIALAEVREAQGDHAGALAVYRQIVATEQTLGGIDQWTDPNPAIAHEALGREAQNHGDRATALREYLDAAARLRRWRRELPYREQIQEALGEGSSERNSELMKRETRIWQQLAILDSQTGQAAEAIEARREASAAETAAARAEAQPSGGS